MAKIVYLLFKSAEMKIESKAIRSLEIDSSFLTIKTYNPMIIGCWTPWGEWDEEVTRETSVNYKRADKCSWAIETEMSEYHGRGTYDDFRRSLCGIFQR